MPLHDNKCKFCGLVFEALVEWDEYEVECHNCGRKASRIYQEFNGIEKSTPDWLYDTLDVVDKEGGQHCQDFLKHPTKGTYKNWLKGSGLRPFEEGESMKLKKRDTSGLRRRVLEKFKKDNTIEVGK